MKGLENMRSSGTETHPSRGGGSTGPAPRSTRTAALLLAAALFSTLLVGLYYSSTWTSLRDFADSMDTGDALFADFTHHFHPTAAGFFSTHRPVQGYYYSAFFALLLSPLGALPVDKASPLWGAAQILFTAFLLLAPLRFLVRRSRLYGLAYYLMVITSMPVLHSFRWGQVSVLIAALAISSFRLYSRGRRDSSALLLALAAAVKYYPAVFAVYYLYKRDWKALRAFLVLLGTFLALPVVFVGPKGLFAFERESIGSVLYSPWVSEEVGSMHLPQFARRLLSLPNSPLLHVALAALGLVAAVAIVLTLVRRGRRWGAVSPERSLCCLFLCLPLVVKTCWQHYFAFLPFCQVIAWLRLRRCRDRPGWIVLCGYFLTAASVLLSSVFLFNLSGSWWSYSAMGCLLIADIILLPVILL
ncbi:MAG: glycosyltransferase family 87 protein [Candidatus Fermentibacteraceae bacterium]